MWTKGVREVELKGGGGGGQEREISRRSRRKGKRVEEKRTEGKGNERPGEKRNRKDGREKERRRIESRERGQENLGLGGGEGKYRREEGREGSSEGVGEGRRREGNYQCVFWSVCLHSVGCRERRGTKGGGNKGRSCRGKCRMNGRKKE